MGASSARPALAGLRRARRELPLALILWGAHLVLAALAVTPFAAGLARVTAYRPAATELLQTPSLDLVAQIAREGGALFGTFAPTLLAAAFLALLSNALLAGGVLEVLSTADDRPLAHRFARGAGHFAGRMLRIGALATTAGALLAALGALPLLAASKRLAEGDQEIAATWLRLGGLALAGLLLLLVLLALDLARVRIVRERRRDTARLLLHSLGTVLRHPIRVVGAWATLTLVLIALVALYVILATIVPAAAALGILVLALAQQLLTIARATLRIALWSAEIEIVHGLTPSSSGTAPTPRALA